MWQDILKERGGQRINRVSISNINKVMSDGKKRTPKEILNEIWNMIESHNKSSGAERIKLTGSNTTLTSSGVPTMGELKRYLSMNYSSGIFHNETGEELPKTTNQRRNVTTKYYR